MPTLPQFTIDRAATIHAISPYVSDNLREDQALGDLVDLSRLHQAITIPENVNIHCEHSSSRGTQQLRIVLSDLADRERVGVTRSFPLGEILRGPDSTESVAAAIERIVSHANELLPTLHALTLGRERIEHEIDYQDPKNLITLLTDRGCTILDEQTVARRVQEEPGPLYYGDIDVCDDALDWSRSGGAWADRLEDELVQAGAVRRESEQAA
jgi:hypothetical protein